MLGLSEMPASDRVRQEIYRCHLPPRLCFGSSPSNPSQYLRVAISSDGLVQFYNAEGKSTSLTGLMGQGPYFVSDSKGTMRPIRFPEPELSNYQNPNGRGVPGVPPGLYDNGRGLPVGGATPVPPVTRP